MGSQVLAVAVRDPQGEIQIHEEPLNQTLYQGFVATTPFLRGITLLWDALGLGMRSLMFSADVMAGDEADFKGPLAWGTVAFSLVLGISLFFLTPAAVASGFHTLTGIESALIGNLLEGAVRLALLIGYVWAVGKMPDIERVYRYHGAEHKTINAYEANAPLEVEIVNNYPIEHPRCGTAFLLTVVIISVLFFALLGSPPLLLRLASRIILLPVIAGVAYEYIRFTARHMSNPLVRFIIKPNLALQRLTTRQPTSDMLEVAIVALERVLAAENAMKDKVQPTQLAETSAELIP